VALVIHLKSPMTASSGEVDLQLDLIGRLAGHGVRYFNESGGAPESPASLAPLLQDLAYSPNGRLRSALIALLLRHPEYAAEAEEFASDLPEEDPARLLLLLSIVVAAALQCEWSFTLDIYLPDRMAIEAGRLAERLSLPPPTLDYGRPCLKAASHLLSKDEVFPANYKEDWENAARRLMAQLAREASSNGA
jgi:hypothetical protein